MKQIKFIFKIVELIGAISSIIDLVMYILHQ